MITHSDPRLILEQTQLLDRFLRYIRIDTQSDENSDSCPSTSKQFDLARLLQTELEELGLQDIVLDDNGYLTASLPGGTGGSVGFCAHMDTAPAFSGAGVEPQLHRDYDGSRIELKNGVCIDPDDNPELLESIGATVITADGTTLLGADDKAGIAVILALVEMLKLNPEIRHPTLRICFNPDEEIGRGAHQFPLKRFGAPVCYTIDGGFQGEMNVETFSADGAVVRFEGISVHPGTARGRMVNALTWMGKFLDRLPMAESPECTHEREGFYHPTNVQGDAAACSVNLILRDFDTAELKQRGERLRGIVAGLTAEEPRLKATVEITAQYRNMADALRERPDVGKHLEQAIRLTGLEPRIEPIRGGTDGSQLTEMGLPTPNVFAGGMNFHGPQEWTTDRGMALAVCTLLNLVQVYAEQGLEAA
jgi:tripeptide aminopeptidase